jgi:hypothetical protein
VFQESDLELMRWTAQRFPALSRWELALTICENLPWAAPNGQPRVHQCLALLEQLAAAGVLALPGKRAPRPVRRARRRAAPLPPLELVAALEEVRPITVEPVPPRSGTPRWRSITPWALSGPAGPTNAIGSAAGRPGGR